MNTKYKIALFYDIYGRPNTGGTTIRPYNIVKMLYKFNMNFKVFCLNPPDPEFNIPGKILNIDKFNPKDFNVFWVENSFKAVQNLNKKGILPILGTNIIPNSAPQHAIPYLDNTGKSRQFSSIQLEENVIKNFKGKFWLSQSDFQEKEYRRLGLPYNTPVYRAPNPIDISLFCPGNKKPEKVIIGWTGKDNWAKHPIFLKQIAEAFSNIIFYCFTDNIIIDLPKNVKIMKGKTNKEVAELLKQCSLFFSTSVTENQPLGVLEAMATGVTVIGFRTSGMPEIIIHKRTGFLVDLGNIEHYIVEINRILKGYYNLQQINHNAVSYIIDNFSEEACIKQYISIFNKYLNKTLIENLIKLK